MTVFVIISLIALISYAGPLILVFRHGLKGNRPRQLFFLYLLDMLLLQGTYLMISLADSKQEALLWYTFHIILVSAQTVSCFFFTQAFLGLKPPRKWAQVAIFAWLSALLGAFLYPGFIYADIYRSEATGLFIPDFTLRGSALMTPAMLLWGLTMFYLGRDYRNARSPLRRARTQYVLLSILIVWVGFTANAWPFLRPYPIDVVANIVGAFLLTYSILRYQLLDINLVIRKGLSYLASAVFIGTGYFFTILVSTRFLQNLTVMQIFLLSSATAILGVILGRPIVDRVELWIDPIFFRGKYGSNLMIQRLSRTATSVLDLEKLTGMILDDLTQTLHIRWAAFFLEQESKFRLVVQRGSDTASGLDMDYDHPMIRWLSSHETAMTTDILDEMLAQDILPQSQAEELRRIGVQMFVPLKARDRLVGALGVSSKPAQQMYSQDDELTLATLANQVAIAIDNARLYQIVRQELVERRRAQAEREELIAELKDKNAEMERFTYTVSHDLKSPLITIKGFLGFLEQDVLAGQVEHIRTDIARLNNAADKMQQLLDELLDLSRIGRLANPPQLVSMTELAYETAELVAGQLTARGVQVDIAPDMPTVTGDRVRLREIYENLLSNAAKYMGDQLQPRVQVGVRHPDAGIVFYVQDNGMGIEPEYHDGVFDLFKKLNPSSEGVGLGLTIVKRIVETHGGKIWVESEGPSKGSTFYFTLPHTDS